MSIEVSCDRCGRRYAVKDAQAGKRGKCLYCGAAVTVPGARREPRHEEPLDALPGHSVSDLLDEELPGTSASPTAAHGAQQKPSPLPAAPLSSLAPRAAGGGVAGWIRDHRLQTAVAVMGVLFFFFYGMAGAHRSMAALVLVGVGIFLIGFLHRAPRSRNSSRRFWGTASVAW